MIPLTDTERADVFDNELNLNQKRVCTTGQDRRYFWMRRNEKVFYDLPAMDCAAELARWEAESRAARTRRGECPGHNANGPVRPSPFQLANREVDYFGYLSFVVARELVAIYELDARQQYLVWREAWQAFLPVIATHREHSDPRTDELLVHQELLARMMIGAVWQSLEICRSYTTDPMEPKIQNAIDDLVQDDEERDILRRHRERKTCREIAAEIGTSKDTVARRLQAIKYRHSLN